LQYALRLCTQHGKAQACILIYGAMGLYEEAVELALTVRAGHAPSLCA
jgi:vacuolar protein sorting-associated protein 18